ncbi:hypothetical protein A5641_24515 [Mycobacterium sp. 1554424.7]|nr:hypothetical protein A5641_24515 [Mycobacterium sp. 1554424.7]
MSQWVIPLGVALIGALATLVAAYLTYVKDRKNERAMILQDLEIADKLPDESRARQVLTTHAENRAQLLPLENYLRWLMRRELGQFIFIVGISIAVPLVSQATGVPFSRLYLAVLYALGTAFIPWFFYNRRRHALIKQYLAEQDLNPNAVANMNDLYLRSYRPIFKLPRWLKRRQ